MNELYRKRADLVKRMQNFLDDRSKTDGYLNVDDDATYSNMERELESIEREIKRKEKIDSIDKALNNPTSTPLRQKGGSDETGRASEEYAKAFANHIRGKHFSNAALQEDTATEGGYLVPIEFEKTLVEKLTTVDPIFELAEKITMGAHEKNVPLVSDQGAASLISEEGSYSESGDTFGQVGFKAYKFGRIIKASEELLEDSAFDLENYLARSLGKSIGNGEAAYFWTGTGTGQPQGVLTGAGSGVTTAVANKISADEVIDLYFAVPQQYRKNSTFVFSDDALKAIRKLKDGNGQYLWSPGLAGTPDTILNRPVFTSTNIPSISSSAKVGVFGDFKNYWIADRRGITFLRLNELYAANGQIGFRGSARTDGHVMDSDAIKVLAMHS